jgi:hypothetical protein
MELEVVNTTPQMQRLQQQQKKTLCDVHLKPKNHNIIKKFTLQIRNLIFIYYEFLNFKPLEVHIF